MFSKANQCLADLSIPHHLTCVLETLPPFETFQTLVKTKTVVLRLLSGFPEQVKFYSLGCYVSKSVYRYCSPDG